jgi:GNAT superfamily N-acetyltransferase
MSMTKVLTKTTYLEMLAPVLPEVVSPVADLRIERLASASVEDYLFLYNSVGANYHWVDRNLLPRDDLQRILGDPAVEIYVLAVGGRPAGYAELDRRTPGEIELAYFGLFPDFLGRGLGKYLLAWAVRQAWSYGPRRVWVHTCDLDHEAALPNYLKAGFQVYAEKTVEQVIPDTERRP